jgi:hypothetical protein
MQNKFSLTRDKLEGMNSSFENKFKQHSNNFFKDTNSKPWQAVNKPMALDALKPEEAVDSPKFHDKELEKLAQVIGPLGKRTTRAGSS